MIDKQKSDCEMTMITDEAPTNSTREKATEESNSDK